MAVKMRILHELHQVNDYIYCASSIYAYVCKHIYLCIYVTPVYTIYICTYMYIPIYIHSKNNCSTLVSPGLNDVVLQHGYFTTWMFYIWAVSPYRDWHWEKALSHDESVWNTIKLLLHRPICTLGECRTGYALVNEAFHFSSEWTFCL